MAIPFITQSIRGLTCENLGMARGLGKWTHRANEKTVKSNYARIKPYLQGSILDVGVGSGTWHCFLSTQGHDVAAGVDVKNLSMYGDILPTIYDGVTLPYKNNQFDTAILLWVLHHTYDPRKVLKEVKRVAKRVVVVENVYTSGWERRMVSWSDQIGNFEFYDHPYLTVNEWRSYMKREKWSLVGEDEWKRVSYGFLYAHDYLFVIE